MTSRGNFCLKLGVFSSINLPKTSAFYQFGIASVADKIFLMRILIKIDSHQVKFQGPFLHKPLIAAGDLRQ